MALAKKGSRRITVDGVEYRWCLRRRPTWEQDMCHSPATYAVECAATPGTTLLVTTNLRHPSSVWGRESPGSVLPSDVAANIRLARSGGWAPESPGSPFHLDQSAGFETPY
ncbi:hypothetical protein [Embleya sp. NPDC001921]